MMNLFLLIFLSALHEQTDWMGGSGILGPVSNWGTQYYQSDSITTATEGQVSLIATQWDYASTGWVKHVIDTSSYISGYLQGLMPADIDNDNLEDCAACSRTDQISWYKNIGNYSFQKNVIGIRSGTYGGCRCTYPYDLDKDADIDVLVAGWGGLGWYENISNGSSWVWHPVDDTSAGGGWGPNYHRVSSADVDLDGHTDIVAALSTDATEQLYGSVYVFRNSGNNLTFSKELVAYFPYGDYDGWRVYAADFNKDGYPDIYSVGENVYVFLNDGTGHFNQSYYYPFSSGQFDGAWAEDIDMDGNMDLVCGEGSGNFVAFLGDGSGTTFSKTALPGATGYIDGAIARDIDLDGFPDIAGTSGGTGFFRQNPANPLNFTYYSVDVPLQNSHWVYIAPISKCVPSINLLVTDDGKHIVYENKMLKAFASNGWLTSSILELASQKRSLQWFGWDICLPGDSTIAFRWRADTLSAGVTTQPWSSPYYAQKTVDSISLPANPCYRFFQYKIEFRPTKLPDTLDIAVLYKVWVSYDTCTGAAAYEETGTFKKFNLQVIDDKILLSASLPHNNVTLSIYNISGELVQVVYQGSLESRDYVFTPKLQTKSVYLVVLNYPEGKETAKLIKLK